jgi:hypothetical protein
MAQQTMNGAPTGIIHIHSDYSHDGRDSLERLHDFAAERAVDFVAMTDHAEDLEGDGYEAYINHCRAVSSESVTIIPGLEFRFAGYPGLHLLALGLTRWIEPQTPEAFVQMTRGHARLTIVAHPILPAYQVPDSVRAGIDAIEVWNAAYNTRFLPDPKAIRLLQEIRGVRPQVVGTAGLDQHDSRNDRELRIRLLQPATDVLGEMKAGRFMNIGRTVRFGSDVPWGTVRLALLSAGRAIFDRAERLQERISLGLR